MRSHSSLLLGFQQTPDRRARPTCKLSLATASASTTTKTTEMDSTTVDFEEVDAMQVDGDPSSSSWSTTVTAESSPSWSVVPFPTSEGSTRKHALLRSCPSSSDDSQCSTDPCPPRKRTRTSALLSPSSTKSHRPRSTLALMRTPLPSRLPRSTTATSSASSSKPSPTTATSKEPFTYTFLPSPPNSVMAMPRSPLLDLISELVTSAETAYSPLPPNLHRNKSFSGGTITQFNVYKTLLHGLASRYLPTSRCLQDSTRSMVKTQLDVQDAMLAERLRGYFTLQGHDVSRLPFEVEKAKSDEESMATDDPFVSDVASPEKTEGSSPSPGLVVMPYDQLVSYLLLQKRLEGRSKGLRLPVVRHRSKLAESVSVGPPSPS